MTGVPISELRHRFTIEAPESVPDGLGGVDSRWVPVAGVWGALRTGERPGPGERERADRAELGVRHRVTLRWRPGLDGSHRLRLGARILHIHGIADPDGRRRHLVLQVEEITP